MRAIAIACVALLAAGPALAHDIYTGVKGKDGQLCCGGTDCAKVEYHIKGAGAEFQVSISRNEWVWIPNDRITFLPVPGDPDQGDAHLCSRPATDGDRINQPEKVFGTIYLYCAFLDPGSM